MDGVFFQEEKIGLDLPEIANKTIFFSVLNWGIGHATRSIPIIQHYLDLGNSIIIFSDGEAYKLLALQFPELIIHVLPSYNVQYKLNKLLFIDLLIQSFHIKNAIQNERNVIAQFHHHTPADIVISDNRYGCYIQGKENFFITHQLKIKSYKWVEYVGQKLISNFISPFKEIWIPDYKSVNLSGELANVDTKQTKRWIGLESIKREASSKSIDILFILSGPEPRRSQLEKKYLDLIPKIKQSVTFIAGNFQNQYAEYEKENLTYFSYKSYAETLDCISMAKLIICRSGYSSLIDLYKLKKKNIICIPTQGQPEQEYLAKHWCEKKWVKMIEEDDMDEQLIQLIDDMIE